MRYSPKKVSSIASTAERGWSETLFSQHCWNKGNKLSMRLNCWRNADGETPICVSTRISLKKSDNLSAPTWLCIPNTYITANVKSFNQASPASVSHKADSGCWLRWTCACRCRWMLLLDRLTREANFRKLCLPLFAIWLIIRRLVVRISCVVLFFWSLTYRTRFRQRVLRFVPA